MKRGFSEMSENTQPVSLVDNAARTYDATFDKPELVHEESDSDLSEGISVDLAEVSTVSSDVLEELMPLENLVLAIRRLSSVADVSETEEDSSSRTYVASLAICHPHDFYVNVDVAASVKVSKDRKSALCPGGHWIDVAKTKVRGTHGGDLRKISPH